MSARTVREFEACLIASSILPARTSWMTRSMNGRPLNPEREMATYARSRIRRPPRPATIQISVTTGPAPRIHSFISVLAIRAVVPDPWGKTSAPCRLQPFPMRSDMSIRLRLTLALLTLALGACSRPDADSKPAAAATPAPPFDLAHVDKARQTGSESAKVWFIMGSDFECPFCRDFHDKAWPSIEQDYVRTGKIRVAFMNFPMNMKSPPMHPRSVPAAEVAMCAGAQDKFWQMHDSLFATQDKWARAADPMPVWTSLARSLGLDEAA